MYVKIKDLAVDMEVKNSGVEFDVSDNDGKHLGDFIVTKTGVTWCRGKTTVANGKRVKWAELMSLLDSQN